MSDIIQRRAKHAWEQVSHAKTEQAINEGKYQTWAQKLPTLILQCGILPTLAFLKAKGAEQDKVGKACSEWLLKPDGGASLIPWTRNESDIDESDIIELLQNEDSDVYRAAQAEAIRYAVWLKRFAEGYLEGEDAAGSDQDEGGTQP